MISVYAILLILKDRWHLSQNTSSSRDYGLKKEQNEPQNWKWKSPQTLQSWPGKPTKQDAFEAQFIPILQSSAQVSSQPASEQAHRGKAQDSEKVRVLRQGYHRPTFGGCWMCSATGGHRAFHCHSPQRTIWRTGGVEGCRQWQLNCWTKQVCLPQTSGWSSKQMPGLLSHFGSGFSYLQPNALEWWWHSSVT